MATFIQINQGHATEAGRRSTNKIWYVVNTTLDDEELLMKEVFAPLVILDASVPENLRKEVDEAFDRFFVKGMFLMKEQYDVLNQAIDEMGFNRVELKEDGKYYQPTLPKKFRPCAKSWKNNGLARSAEMKEVLKKYKAGEYTLNDLEKPSPMIAMMQELIGEAQESVTRIDGSLDNILLKLEGLE